MKKLDGLRFKLGETVLYDPVCKLEPRGDVEDPFVGVAVPVVNGFRQVLHVDRDAPGELDRFGEIGVLAVNLLVEARQV